MSSYAQSCPQCGNSFTIAPGKNCYYIKHSQHYYASSTGATYSQGSGHHAQNVGRCRLAGCSNSRKSGYDCCSREHGRKYNQSPKCKYPGCQVSASIGYSCCSRTHSARLTATCFCGKPVYFNTSQVYKTCYHHTNF